MPPEKSPQHLRVSSVAIPHNDRKKHWATDELPRNDPSVYSNEGLRNIHIWSSEPEHFSSDSTSLILLGGFFQSHPSDTSRHFSNNEVYDMLGIILMSTRNSDLVRGDLLLKLEEDPRTASRLPTVQEVQTLPPVYRDQLGARANHQIDPMEPGHYLLVDYDQSFGYIRLDIARIAPKLKDPKIFSRSRRKDETKLASRKRRVAEEVRRRDGRCRVSGEEAPIMERGYNMGGLEVAHIYPLAYARDIYEDAELPRERIFILRLGMTQNAYNIDDVRNAMLLRRDVHTLFDDYQFSFVCRLIDDGNGGTIQSWEVVRFEEDAAEFISDEPTPKLLQRLNLREIAPASITGRKNEVVDLPVVPAEEEIFFRMHFRTAVRWHVAGAGRRQARGAILVQKKVIW